MRTTRPKILCQGCEEPTPDQAFLCTECAQDLAQVFGEIAGLAEDLLVSMSRRARIDRPPAPVRLEDVEEHRAATLSIQLLPVDLDAGEHLAALRTTVTAWADSIARVRGLARPLNTWAAVGQFLVHQVPWLRHREEAGELLSEAARIKDTVLAFVDRPTPTWYVGPCGASVVDDDGLLQECTADMHATSGAESVTCWQCKTVHQLEPRRRRMLAAAEDKLVHAALLARAVTVLGEPVTAAQVYGYAHRKRLIPRGRDGNGRPLYRIGDLRQILAEDQQRSSKKQHTQKAGA